jgi:tetratricopeptide (TPR) repeat protein
VTGRQHRSPRAEGRQVRAASIGDAEHALRRRLAACRVPEERRHLTLELVVLYSHCGQHALAMEQLRRLLEATADPAEQADYLLGLGQLMEQAGDYAGAGVFYREGLALVGRLTATTPSLHGDPHYLLHNNLGHCLNQSGQHVEAEARCRAAIAIDPERHDAHRNLGVALEGQGRYAAAAEAFLLAVERCPADPRALRHLEQLLAAHAGVAAEIPDFAARLDACRELVADARRRLLARLSG